MPDRAQVLAELARRGALPEQHRQEYERIKAAGGIAPKGGFKPMPTAAADKLEEQVNAFAGLDRAVTSFKDDYSGPGSEFENTAQAAIGTGTPGQRDWWAAFRASDNQVRNALFGASLTPSEQASFAQTSISPGMTAKEVRANLERRRELARGVLSRRAAFARTNGYAPEAVAAILGEYDPARQAGLEPVSVGDVVDRAIGLNGPDGAPEVQPDGSVRVRAADGTYATYASRDAYADSQAEDDLARVFGGDKNGEAYRTAYRARFGRDAPIEVDVGPDGEKVADVGDGAFGSFMRGAGDAVTFGTLDELGAVADAVVGKGGDGDFASRMRNNLSTNRSILNGDEQRHPYARFSGQLVGAASVPFGASARTAGELARVGAVSGGAYGFGSAEGDVLQRVPNALAGAAVGAGGGYAFGRLAPAAGDVLARFRGAPSQTRVEANALAQAGERQGVPLMAADLRPGARNTTALLEASPGGAGPIQSAMAEGTDALELAAGRIGGGTAQSQEVMGSMIQDAGRRMIDRTRQVKNDLYGQAERLAPTANVRSQGALDAVNRNIAELSETPNANRSLLSLLSDLRDDLVTVDQSTGASVPRSLSIGSIRNLRTAMRGEIGSRNLTMTDAERRVSQVIDAASADIEAALVRSDPRAAAAYRRADRYYAERQRYIRDVVQYYVGPRDRPISGEQAYQRVMALASTNGDRERLAAVMRGLSTDERADVATTVASQLGRRTADDDFSPARFVTQAEKMAPAVRVAVFGREGATAIDDLIRIAAAKRDTGNSLNRSRSGQVTAYDRMLTGGLSLLGGAGGYAAGGAPGAVAGAVIAGAGKAGALNLSARLLTNPQFVAWLGRAPRTSTPQQIEAHVRQLSSIAIRQPAIRGEISQLQRLLSESGTSRSIASEGRESDDQQGNRNQAAAAGR